MDVEKQETNGKDWNVDYGILGRQAEALIAGVPHLTANLANISALLFESLPDINWAGFYFLGKVFELPERTANSEQVQAPSADPDRTLILGPFQGRPACLEIPWGNGVCGSAAAADETLVVPDVHAFPGHIACDMASRSEIVIPLPRRHGDAGEAENAGPGAVIGVLDIDSPVPARFSEADRAGLEALAGILEKYLF